MAGKSKITQKKIKILEPLGFRHSHFGSCFMWQEPNTKKEIEVWIKSSRTEKTILKEAMEFIYKRGFNDGVSAKQKKIQEALGVYRDEDEYL